jgi:hypothetical protein
MAGGVLFVFVLLCSEVIETVGHTDRQMEDNT